MEMKKSNNGSSVWLMDKLNFPVLDIPDSPNKWKSMPAKDYIEWVTEIVERLKQSGEYAKYRWAPERRPVEVKFDLLH